MLDCITSPSCIPFDDGSVKDVIGQGLIICRRLDVHGADKSDKHTKEIHSYVPWTVFVGLYYFTISCAFAHCPPRERGQRVTICRRLRGLGVDVRGTHKEGYTEMHARVIYLTSCCLTFLY